MQNFVVNCAIIFGIIVFMIILCQYNDINSVESITKMLFCFNTHVSTIGYSMMVVSKFGNSGAYLKKAFSLSRGGFHKSWAWGVKRIAHPNL
jgi:hypothetical protein